MHGHLVIADISGYTQFLTENELEHANGIIGDLLNAVINSIEAPLSVSSIEGDAVFMYGAMPEEMSGQSVLESVELLYYSFASALESMVLNTTCTCNACVNIKNLGLKIVMHCGEYVTTNIGGRETLSGPDVILAHRLLKNQVQEKTGIDDYMLVTQACVDDLKVGDIVAGWIPHSEEYEHVGEVSGYVSSLPDMLEFMRQQNENKVIKDNAWLAVAVASKAPPAVVWDHLVDPVKRTRWMNAHDNQVTGFLDGRIGPGSEYHCAHGDEELTVFTVLDMRPLNYLTILLPLDGGIAVRYTDYVVASGTGSRIVTYLELPFVVETGEPVESELVEEMRGFLLSGYSQQMDRLTQMADEAAEELTPA